MLQGQKLKFIANVLKINVCGGILSVLQLESES